LIAGEGGTAYNAMSLGSINATWESGDEQVVSSAAEACGAARGRVWRRVAGCRAGHGPAEESAIGVGSDNGRRWDRWVPSERERGQPSELDDSWAGAGRGRKTVPAGPFSVPGPLGGSFGCRGRAGRAVSWRSTKGQLEADAGTGCRWWAPVAENGLPVAAGGPVGCAEDRPGPEFERCSGQRNGDEW